MAELLLLNHYLISNLKEYTFHMEATRFEDTDGTHIVKAHLEDEDLSKPVGWAVEGACDRCSCGVLSHMP